MGSWAFLTNHARVLLCDANDPGACLRDSSAALGITEGSAYAIVTDPTEDGYVVKSGTAAVTVTRSGPIARCQNPPAGNPPLVSCPLCLHTSTMREGG